MIKDMTDWVILMIGVTGVLSLFILMVLLLYDIKIQIIKTNEVLREIQENLRN